MDKLEIIEITNELVEDLIYEIRGQKVMLDFDLARLYGYETKAFNQQIKRNINKFPEEFMFQLTKGDMDKILMCQNVTSSWGGTRKLPYAFTEQGIYMLMTVLKEEIAYHSGASSKDAGNRLSTITRLEYSHLYHCVIDNLKNG